MRCLEQVLTFIGYQIQRGQHEVVRDFSEVPAIMADPNQLKQVYINLIMNAVQAMSTPGTITLTTRALPYGVEIDIADTGKGVEEDIRDKIFQPFYTTKPEGEGTGLGLYLCRKIMSEHEGSLNFESTLGEGSRFHYSSTIADPISQQKPMYTRVCSLTTQWLLGMH